MGFGVAMARLRRATDPAPCRQIGRADARDFRGSVPLIGDVRKRTRFWWITLASPKRSKKFIALEISREFSIREQNDSNGGLTSTFCEHLIAFSIPSKAKGKDCEPMNVKAGKRIVSGRLPVEVEAWLRKLAEYNASTISAEIARLCREQMENEKAGA